MRAGATSLTTPLLLVGVLTAASATGLCGHATRAALTGQHTRAFDPDDYGAIGSGTRHPAGSALGVRTLAGLATYRYRNGTQPYAWALDPLFGLTFSVPLDHAQGAPGLRLDFVIAADNLARGPTSTAYNYAVQADTVQAGMAVSGDCITPGTAVASVASALPMRAGTSQAQPAASTMLRFAFTGGIVPGEVASGPSIPAGDRVAAVTADTVTLAAATDATLGAGTAVDFAGAAFVMLSRPTLQACAAGRAITFSLSDRQVQALDMDWLGIQAAVAAAWHSPYGGAVFIPRGDYLLNRMVADPGISDANESTPQVEIDGDGMLSTRLHLLEDTGYGSCALGEDNRSQHSVSRAMYQNFRLIGPGTDMRAGHLPAASDGLCIGEKARVQRVQSSGFHAGFSLMRDHQVLENVEAGADYFGLELAANGDTFGNQHLSADSFSGTLAGIAVAWDDTLEYAFFNDVSLGFGPYSLYREAAPAGRTPPVPMLGGCTLNGVYAESVGNGFIYGENGAGDAITTNVWIGVSPVLDATRNYRLEGRPVRAVVAAGTWFQNTLIGSDFGNPANDRLVTDAIFTMADNIQASKWLDPTSSTELIMSATKPMFQAKVVLFDSFATDRAAGDFLRAEQPIAAGQIVASGRGAFDSTAVVMRHGLVPLGIALSTATTGGIIAIARSGLALVAAAGDASLDMGAPVAPSPADPGEVAAAGDAPGMAAVGVVAGPVDGSTNPRRVWVDLTR